VQQLMHCAVALILQSAGAIALVLVDVMLPGSNYWSSFFGDTSRVTDNTEVESNETGYFRPTDHPP
jgi:hypothetical protein